MSLHRTPRWCPWYHTSIMDISQIQWKPTSPIDVISALHCQGEKPLQTESPVPAMSGKETTYQLASFAMGKSTNLSAQMKNQPIDLGAGVGHGYICGCGAALTGGFCGVRRPRNSGQRGAGARHLRPASCLWRSRHPARLLLLLLLLLPLRGSGTPPNAFTKHFCGDNLPQPPYSMPHPMNVRSMDGLQAADDVALKLKHSLCKNSFIEQDSRAFLHAQSYCFGFTQPQNWPTSLGKWAFWAATK